MHRELPATRGGITTRRNLRNEKVRGSSPLSSTRFNIALTRPFAPLAGEQDCSCISRVCPRCCRC